MTTLEKGRASRGHEPVFQMGMGNGAAHETHLVKVSEDKEIKSYLIYIIKLWAFLVQQLNLNTNTYHFILRLY